MTAGEYCNRDVIVAELNTTISEAAKLMRHHHVGDLVLIDKQNSKTLPKGIITDRDLVIEILAQDIDPGSVCVKDLISSDLVTVGEAETLLNTLAIMQNESVRRIVVVNDEGQLEGLLSADDVIEIIAEAMNSLTKLIKHEFTREYQKRP